MKYARYQKLSREKIGPCNICGSVGELTWDHIPPKNSYNHFPIKYNPLLPIANKDEIIKTSTSQNGIRYRTICRNCNNNLLGLQYDPSLKEFTDLVKRYMITETEIPDNTCANIKINRLCRAICGHLLASLPIYDDTVLIDRQLREFVLNPQQLPPSDMQLLTWPYPYNSIVISRNFVVAPQNEQIHFPDGVTSVISAFPVSYVLHTGHDNCGLTDLFSYCTTDIDEETSVPVDFKAMLYPGTSVVRNLCWPCDLSDSPFSALIITGTMLYFNGSIIAMHSPDNVRRIMMR